jgi:S1-C subfamily serine protease
LYIVDMRKKELLFVLAVGLLLAAAPAFAQVTVLDLQAQVEAVYSSASASVVNITTQTLVYGFYRKAVPQEGTGSGFIFDTQGHVVTNDHVVSGARAITVTLTNGKVFTAKIVGEDAQNDLAVLQISGAGIPAPLALADSSALSVGQFVVALGSPFRLQGTLTFGVISALGRTIQSPDNKFIGEAIQTDAPINPGNSGGPLLDLQGRVIGINSQILSPSGTSAGIGFAVPARTIQRVVPLLISRGSYPHPYLGFDGLSLPEYGPFLKSAGASVPSDTGFLVLKTTAGGPAARAGIRGGTSAVQIGGYAIPVGGDVIVAIDGNAITSEQDFAVYLETKTKVGDTITVTVLRGGKMVDLKATLAEQPN